MNEGQNRRSRPEVVVTVIVVLLSVMYALSVGPMTRFRVDGVIQESPWDVVYSPLGWLHDHTPLGWPLDWYVELWTEEYQVAPPPVDGP